MTCTNGIWVKSIILNRGQTDNGEQFVPCFSPAMLNRKNKMRLFFLNRSQNGSIFIEHEQIILIYILFFVKIAILSVF